MSRFFSIAILFWSGVSLLIGGCSDTTDESRLNTTHYVFGTLVEFNLRAGDRAHARQVVAKIGASFRDMHRDWHAWQPGKLTELNGAIARGETIPLDMALSPLITQSTELSHTSKGLFNPAIGGLVALWGFHQDERPSGPPPDVEAINRWVSAAPSMSDLIVKDGTIHSSNRSVQLDFGGFAKGYALELAQQQLLDGGIEHGIVNAGGDLCVLGNHGERAWRVAIRDPIHFGVLAQIELQDQECAMTSGNYERFREHNDRRYAHIIDPRSGWPVDHIASATVIALDGGLADAAATALTVAGPVQWVEIARSMGLDEALVVDQQGQIQVTRKLASRLRWPSGEPGGMMVVDLD